jgi:serine/threonine protein kinase
MYTGLSGKSITLGSLIAKGGEGEVFSIVGDNANCIKIYHPNIRNKEKEEKLKYMSLNEPHNIEGKNYKICWPKDVIYQNRKFVGFMMPKAFENSSLPYHLCQPNIPKELPKIWHNTFNRKSVQGIISRLKLCTNIVAAIKRIHDTEKYVIVDLKPQNLLVTSGGRVSIIDLDSAQISVDDKIIFKAPVSTPEYTPPEASDIIKSNLPITKDWDVFSVGVVIYEILCGIHPYVGSAKPPNDNLNTIQEKIKNNVTYITIGKSKFNVLPTPHNTFDSYSVLLKNSITKIFHPYKLGVSSRPKMDEIGERLFTEVKTHEEQAQKKQDLINEREKDNALANNRILKKQNERILISIENELIKNKKLQDEITLLSGKKGGNEGWIIFLTVALIIAVIFAFNFGNQRSVLKEDYESLKRYNLRLKNSFDTQEASKDIKINDLIIRNKDLDNSNRNLQNKLNSDEVLQFPFKVNVNVDFVNIHRSPNSSSEINWGWDQDSQITIRGLTNNGYYKINYNYQNEGTTTGYIKTTDVIKR